MTPNPITLALYTTTKGHFKRTDIYRQTVQGLLSQVPREGWGGMVAHIKHDNESNLGEMAEWLASQGFRVIQTQGQWKHFDVSHQMGYAGDCQRVVSEITTPYVAHWEDDWIVAAFDRPLEYWLHEATSMLAERPNLAQVRIARFTNEHARINGLMAKHGIDARAGMETDKAFNHSDLSMNPSIFRTRDLRAALAFFHAVPSLPRHIEHGLSPCLKLISGAPLPFACLNPARIRVGHLGVSTIDQEDDLTKPLYAD